MKLEINKEELRPLIREIVAEALAELERHRAKLGDRLAYSEAEAADALGLKQHVLRDARLRGEITATRIAAGRIRYSREDLLEYLANGRER